MGGESGSNLFELREVVIDVEGSGVKVPRIVFGKALARTVRQILEEDRNPYFESDAIDLDTALNTGGRRVHVGTWTVHALRRAGELGHPDLPADYLSAVSDLEQALPVSIGGTLG